jgi:hypothetical protein
MNRLQRHIKNTVAGQQHYQGRLRGVQGKGKPWRGGRQGFVLSGDGLGLIAGGHGMDPSRPLLAPIERIGPGIPENDNLVQELALVL